MQDDLTVITRAISEHYGIREHVKLAITTGGIMTIMVW